MRYLWLGAVALIVAPAIASAMTTGQTPPAQATPPVMIPTAPTTTQYDPRMGFPDHNGPLSAMMIIIPQKELDEFNGDNGGTRHLDRVSRAEAGAVLAVKLVFVGIQGDWNGNANLTYDLQVYQPDGQLYANSNYTSLDALHGKIGSGQGVFDNRGKIVLMQFEDQDMPGVYTLKATLHDNIAHRDVPLQTTVELLPKAVGGTPQTLPPDVANALTGTGAAPGTMAPIADPDDDATPAPAKGKVKGKGHRRHRRHH